jgi:hypothetical protein
VGNRAVLLLIGAWQLVVWRQKRSELLRPEALRLERNNPEHLVGREDDIAALEQKCRGHGLVFLEGESGSGKSALVQAGLLPRLRADGRLLPLAVSIWGTDWERGPQRELADELWARLDTDQHEKLKLASPPEPDALAQALGAMRGTLGLTPLVVFDQFDDYQARHRGKFLPGKSRSWLTARRLKETNAFWRAVAVLCEQQSVHALIVTRSDTAADLESVGFHEPETHRLDRLQTAYVAPLLAELAGTGDSRPGARLGPAAPAAGPRPRARRLRPAAAAQVRARRPAQPAVPDRRRLREGGGPRRPRSGARRARSQKRGAHQRLNGGDSPPTASCNGRRCRGLEDRGAADGRADRRCRRPEGR